MSRPRVPPASSPARCFGSLRVTFRFISFRFVWSCVESRCFHVICILLHSFPGPNARHDALLENRRSRNLSRIAISTVGVRAEHEAAAAHFSAVTKSFQILKNQSASTRAGGYIYLVGHL